MGCDIHTIVEIKNSDTWCYYKDFEPFDWRSYGLFGFLADVRNYSEVPPISQPRGIPKDLSEHLSKAIADDDNGPWLGDHSFSWILLQELLDFNYDITFADKRGNAPEIKTFRELLGDCYFADLEKLKAIGAPDQVRIVFGFDS